MSLFSRQQKWQDDNDRMREKLLSLIGKIGKDARVAKTTTRVSNIYSHIYFSSTNHLTVMQLLVVANCQVHGGFNDVKLIAVIQRRIMKWSYNYGNSLPAQNVSVSDVNLIQRDDKKFVCDEDNIDAVALMIAFMTEMRN